MFKNRIKIKKSDMRYLIPLVLLLGANWSISQDLTATQVLEKSIAFHDPNNQWKSFDASFDVVMEAPESSNRNSTIYLNLPKEVFKLDVERDGEKYGYHFKKQECAISLNGSSDISEEQQKKYRLTCERGNLMRNYYTYLYGLPMKLKDPGTNLDDKVERKTFKGKEYLVLKVDYDQGGGDDIWYFYFNPVTFAMEIYQFYHDEQKGDGEYILLNGIEEIDGIKMPKTRAWYYNKDDKYLATDILNTIR